MLAHRSPGAANGLLKKIRILMRFGIERGWRQDDPAVGIRRYPAGRGHHTWTEDEIRRFEQRWPLATRERLAFDLILYTGQRRSDVIGADRSTVRRWFTR
jgi:integrase